MFADIIKVLAMRNTHARPTPRGGTFTVGLPLSRSSLQIVHFVERGAAWKMETGFAMDLLD